MTILLAGLLLAAAWADDTDPEPPRANAVVARLVAKKSTYAIDRKGNTAEEYAKAARLGRAPAVPVELELIITNNRKTPVRIRTKGTSPKLTLTLKGPGAVEATPPAALAAVRQPITYVTLRPGEKLTLPVESLGSYTGTRTTKLHYWTEPGEYTLAATFYTRVDLDFDPNGPAPKKLNYMTLEASAIKLKVEK